MLCCRYVCRCSPGSLSSGMRLTCVSFIDFSFNLLPLPFPHLSLNTLVTNSTHSLYLLLSFPNPPAFLPSLSSCIFPIAVKVLLVSASRSLSFLSFCPANFSQHSISFFLRLLLLQPPLSVPPPILDISTLFTPANTLSCCFSVQCHRL